MTSENATPRRNRTAEFRRLVGGGYQVRLQHQVVYFDGVAALLWRNLDGATDIQRLGELVQAEYTVEADQAREDIIEFVCDLAQRGFLEDD